MKPYEGFFTFYLWFQLLLHSTLLVKFVVASNDLHDLQETILGLNQTFFTQCQANADCHCVGHPPGECVADCNDCTGYYVCYLDHYEHKNCPIGEIYYPATQSCAPGKCPRTDCHKAPPITPPTTTIPLPTPPLTTTTTTKPPTPSSPTTTTTTSTTIPPPPECPIQIPICQYDGEILPDPQHCSYFWTCQHGCAVLSFCYPGMWYDPIKKVCDYRQNVVTCIASRD